MNLQELISEIFFEEFQNAHLEQLKETSGGILADDLENPTTFSQIGIT